MPKSLIIAEKPSVAQDIAHVLGVDKGADDCFENSEYIITSALGHLVEIYNADEETADSKKRSGPDKHSKWSMQSLPVLPSTFSLRALKAGKKRIQQITKLATRSDLSSIINACDAGREGELIFHYIARLIGFDKEVKRLWLQSMTPAAIRRGFAELRSAADLQPLCDAAKARNEADWLVGINATRALTALNSKHGGFFLTTVGRVQTPTLALLVTRERERRAHVARQYWNMTVAFEVAAGTYEAKWTKPATAVAGPKDREDRSDRIWEQQELERLRAIVQGSPAPSGEATDVSTLKRQSPPGLFDLNGLQREANRRHSLPARRTLGALQSLYERYKLLTYPRTESRHLPADYITVCQEILAKFANDADSAYLATGLAAHAKSIPAADVAAVGKRVFDDAKISDHFAIIPTGQLPKEELPDIEAKIYELACRRFVAAFMPVAQVRETVRTTVIAGETFKAKGQIIVAAGWLAAAKNIPQDRVLPPLASASENATVVEVDIDHKETTPPSRYDEAALLGAMQGAYKFVEEEDLAEALNAGGGLGTPATRAAVIEELINHKYVVRDGKELIPQRKAFSLLALLTGMNIDEMVKPSLTGAWESRLQRIETGEENVTAFIEDIREFAGKICAVAKTYDPDATPGTYAELQSPCPKCAGAMQEGYRKYVCGNCGFFFWKTLANRQMNPAEAEVLLSEGKVGPFEDFESKYGKPFAATLVLQESGKITFEFTNDQQNEEVDVATLATVGKCPKCQSAVLATPLSYSCTNLLDGSGKCDFKLRNIICQRELTVDEAAVMFAERKSILLRNFISKRGKPFNAYLTLNDVGKLGFEFENTRAPAKKSKSTKKTKTAKKKIKERY